MSGVRVLPFAAALLLAAVALGCSSQSPTPAASSPRTATVPTATQPSTTVTPTAPPSGATPEPAPSTSQSSTTPASTPGVPATPALTEVFPREAFANPTVIDNEWYPLVPGTQRITKGKAGIGADRLPHEVLFAVSDVTKVIDGIKTRVVYEEDETDGKLEEAELIFYAQDDTGRVWLMGEYPEEYEEGKVVETPTWLSGIEDAKAGILMQAAPMVDTPSYSEGWGPAVGWNDRARVLETGSKTCVPLRCYEDVLVIDEFNVDQPDAHQLKYYARGASNIRVGWAGALEDTQEVLELTSLKRLDPAAMTKLRNTVMAMEKRAYKLDPDVYGQTQPAEAP